MISAEYLLPGVMHVESGGKPDAVSPKGAIGLYQIMPATGAMYGVSREALFHPEVNRMVATRYLDDLLRRYQGNPQLALAAYNTGPGNVDRGILPAETRAYVGKVFSALGRGISSILPARVATELPWSPPERSELPEEADESQPQALPTSSRPPSSRPPAPSVRPRTPFLGAAHPEFVQSIRAMLNEDQA
jgi:hypothetical protein